MGEAPETPQDQGRAPEQRPALGLLASLCVLVAVFYFINAACSGGDDSSSGSSGAGGSAGSGPPPVCSTSTPVAASIAFVSPLDGTVVTGPLLDGGVVEIPLALVVNALTPTTASTCVRGTGSFLISVEPSSAFAPFFFAVTNPSIRVPPGEYTLRLSFVNGARRQYVPAITTSVTFVVESNAP